MSAKNRFQSNLYKPFLFVVSIVMLFPATVSANNQLDIYIQMGKEKQIRKDYVGAIDAWTKGLQLAREENNKNGLTKNKRVLRLYMINFLTQIGALHTNLGNYIEAVPVLEDGLKYAREDGDLGLQGFFLTNLGSVLVPFDPSVALSYFEQGLAIAQKNKEGALDQSGKILNRENEGRAFAGIGLVSSVLGDYPRALLSFENSLKIAREIREKSEEGSYLQNIGSVYVDLGDLPQALSFYNQALDIISNSPDIISKGNVLYRIGNTYSASDDYDSAVKYYIQALNVKKAASLPTESTQCAIGAAYLEMGNFEKAFSILKSECRTDHKLMGRYYLKVRDYRLAREQFDREIIPMLEKRKSAFLPEYYIGLGLSHEGLKDYGQAKDYFLKSVNLMEEQRDRLAEAQRKNFFSAKIGGFRRIEAYEGLVRVCTRLGDSAEALYWAENTKARLLLDAMTWRGRGERLGIPNDLFQRESGLISRIASNQRQMDEALERNSGRYLGLVKEMESLVRERDSLIARLRAEYPEYASIRYPTPQRVNEFKLQSGEALIEYAVTDQETFTWLVRNGKVVKAVSIPITRKNLSELVERYRGFFKTKRDKTEMMLQLTRFDPSVGKELNDLILKDLETELKPGEQVVIIPDGVLGRIPFEALVTSVPPRPETETGKYGAYPVGVRYFGEEYSVSLYQSGTALSLVRTLKKTGVEKSFKMLILADPDFGTTPADSSIRMVDYYSSLKAFINRSVFFDPLKLTRDMAQKFKDSNPENVDLLMGENASKRQLRSKSLNQYRYQIYATHGIIDNQIAYIKEPALVLSQSGINPEKDALDGFLTMTEVMDLKMKADLVALTACNTGIGKNLSGEGVMGMGRAFQYAGSRSVLMSLWSVEDVSTNILTERYFAHLKTGKDKVEALRLARLDLRHTGYEHPYYWAPFILVGER